MERVKPLMVVIAGTRPEVIKLAPVFHQLQKKNVKTEFWLTGQHSTLAEGPAQFFGIESSVKWNILKPGQSSNELFSKLLNELGSELARKRPSVVVVQGDTTTALAGALAAFHLQIPVAHVEAGLRSGDLNSPFPEEMNRRVIDVFSRWRFPPTKLSRNILIKEGYSHVSEPTGNTGIDALVWAREKVRKVGQWPKDVPRLNSTTQLILSTGHRRENLGEPLKRILGALGNEIQNRPNTFLVHVAHPNPTAHQIAVNAFGHLDRVHLISALNYPDFVALMDRASVVVTDSGGIQEEAPSFGLPVLITREETERPEVLSYRGVLIGTDPTLLKAALDKALLLERKSKEFIKTSFGDGQASVRIVDEILEEFPDEPSELPYFSQLERTVEEVPHLSLN